MVFDTYALQHILLEYLAEIIPDISWVAQHTLRMNKIAKKNPTKNVLQDHGQGIFKSCRIISAELGCSVQPGILKSHIFYHVRLA